MTTPSIMGSIIRELKEKVVSAEADAAKSFAIAHNSYGSGYDRGFADALRGVLEELTGEKE